MEELAEAVRVAYLVLDDGDRRTLAGAELTPTQFNLLRATEEHEDDPSVSALAQELICTRGNVTRLVARMSSQGLVETVDDAADQRLVRVRITEDGRSRLERARQLLRDHDESRFGRFSRAELDEAKVVLERLIGALREDLDELR